MLLSHTHAFIYIKTRKTAGTSIEGILQPFAMPEGREVAHSTPFLETPVGIVASRAGGQARSDPLSAHASASEILSYVGLGVFDRYTKIYCVRNPFDKVVSWFWFSAPKALRADLQSDPDKAIWFFRNWLMMKPTLPIDIKFYRANAKIIDATRIRYEHLESDIADAADQLGITLDIATLPRWKSDARHLKDVPLAAYYSPETAAIVRQSFRFDFAHFGYAPDVPT